ncbi:hypothetical protein OG21DRAFT_1514692 [Imleria badia]|nr:hypothetical protein OG21DRAFT_1514692 [Imleria badia]
MDSSDFDIAYPSDSDFLPSPIGIDPASLFAPSATSSDADTLVQAAIRPSRRGSRAMTKVPVPIPNLTKKSRGRKVPTTFNGEPIYAASRDKTKKGVRTYTCHADGCGKCFVRGEHLKRHIRLDVFSFLCFFVLPRRSPAHLSFLFEAWMCTYENCTRAFSRRDNLNQHLRIHKLQDDDD